MREILFRGKDVDNDKWVYGAFIPDAIETLYGDKGLDGFIKFYNTDTKKSETIEVERETVGQYTGRKDKNSKKIFEGDILIFFGDYEDGEEPSKHTVEWNESLNAFTAKMQADEDIPPDLMDVWDPSEWEIIGSIYDNPELIGEKENG